MISAKMAWIESISSVYLKLSSDTTKFIQIAAGARFISAWKLCVYWKISLLLCELFCSHKCVTRTASRFLSVPQFYYRRKCGFIYLTSHHLVRKCFHWFPSRTARRKFHDTIQLTPLLRVTFLLLITVSTWNKPSSDALSQPLLLYTI